MSFGDLSTAGGLEKLNTFLGEKSFVKGTELSDEDVKTASEVGSSVSSEKYPNIDRWYKTVAANKEIPQKAKAEAEDDDDVDLFGSDDEVDEEAERVKAQRVKEYTERKAAKGAKPAAKSMVTLDVKGWDDETDLEEMLANVKKIEMDGLLWGGHQFVPVGFGMKKLQINCVVEDDKVLMDDLSEQIEADEDHVQSVDIAAMAEI
ncbi:elongation factor 1-beta/delta [Macrococcus caseolyticus]|nr:elongation factor 1-beta/delta [Macrococcus caseolyticus]RKO11139.1 elongation factor 1-beta/delta [Macrococcus caseolyticus]